MGPLASTPCSNLSLGQQPTPQSCRKVTCTPRSRSCHAVHQSGKSMYRAQSLEERVLLRSEVHHLKPLLVP